VESFYIVTVLDENDNLRRDRYEDDEEAYQASSSSSGVIS
jgi:hypothetical protein